MVEQVILTALAKDPQQRFGSVLAFATALEDAWKAVKIFQDGESSAPSQDSSWAVWGWDDTTGSIIFTYGKAPWPVENRRDAVAWSPDGKWLASGLDKTVMVRAVATGSVVAQYVKHSDHVMALAWSPDSQYLASAGYDNTIQVWEVATSTPIFTYTGQKHII